MNEFFINEIFVSKFSKKNLFKEKLCEDIEVDFPHRESEERKKFNYQKKFFSSSWFSKENKEKPRKVNELWNVEIILRQA